MTDLYRWRGDVEPGRAAQELRVEAARHENGGARTAAANRSIYLVEVEQEMQGVRELRCYLPRAMGVKDRSIVQPREILITLPPPLSGGIFGASVPPCTAIRYNLLFASFQYLGGQGYMFLGTHAQALLL